MLSVALIGPLPPPSGGMANQTLQLAQLLRAEGIAVEIVQVNAPCRPRWIDAIRGVRALARLARYLPRLWRAADKAQLFHVMANSGWSWHLFAAPAVWIARMRGCAVVVNYRGGEAEAFFARSFYVINKTLRRADAVVVPSAFLKRIFDRYRVPACVVPNIIDLDRFSSWQRTLAETGAAHIIVTRNLEPIYDIATVLRAFQIILKQCPGAKLSVAGSGPEERNLQALAASLGIGESTAFLGRIDNERMGELYAGADVMVNASLVDNMPISILEALASCVPVVSTDAGGIPYLVEHEKTALLVPVRDYEAMATAIMSLLNDSAKADALAREGLQLAQQYAWLNVRKGWLAVYASVTAAPLEFAATPQSD